MILPVLLLCVLASDTVPAARPAPDEVVLEDGQTVACRVLRETEHSLHVLRNGRRTTVRRLHVAEVRSVERSVQSLLERVDATSPGDAARLTPLALYAEHAGLTGEAEALWLRVVLADSDNARAWTKLGATETPSGWRLARGERRLSLDDLRAKCADWRHAHEFLTAHFVLRTDLRLERALDLALDLERRYAEFGVEVGAPLELDATIETLRVHVHSSRESFPVSPEPGRRAWWDASGRTVHVLSGPDGVDEDAGRDLDLQLARALLSSSYPRRLDQSTTLPAWIERGVAERFAAGRARDGSAEVLAARHAVDPEPLSLARLMAASESDFVRGDASGRFVAQAFTLTDFLFARGSAEGRAGSRALEAIAEFARSAALGRATPARLIELLRVDEGAMIAAWHEHARAVGGR